MVNTLFDGETFTQENLKEQGVVQSPLYFLAKSLEKMSECHAVYFCNGWETPEVVVLSMMQQLLAD